MCLTCSQRRITNGTCRLNKPVPLFLLPPPPPPQLHRYMLQTVPTRTTPPNATPASEYTPADLKILDSLLGGVLIEIRNYGPHSGAHKLIIIPWPSSIHSPECMDTNMAEGNEWIVGAEGVPTRTTSSGSSKAGNAPIIMFKPGPPEVC
ncbi:hypothetical protein C8R44DRAFT_728429 [Mycena epipterygia]|nr:hypothetical protein C8R44DRAFT_728429 [Mycena epipterygia]